VYTLAMTRIAPPRNKNSCSSPADHSDAGEPNKRAQQIDAISALDLEGNLATNLVVPVAVGQEGRVPKRNRRPTSFSRIAIKPRLMHFEQQERVGIDPRFRADCSFVARQDLEHAVRELYLRALPIGCRGAQPFEVVPRPIVNVTGEDSS
jgi:hypothetical protein